MAVYTHLATHEIEALLAAYDLGRLTTAIGIAEGVENSNYLLVLEQAGAERKVILTVFEKRVEVAELPFYLDLMSHLAGQAIPCPLPLAARDGGVLRYTEGGKPFVLVSFLTGRSVRQASVSQLTELGTINARLHLAARSYPQKRANNLSLAGWRRLYEKTAQRADEVQVGLAALIEEELLFLMEHWPQVGLLPSGVVHADLFPDNVFFLGDTLSGVIDFYFACNDLWAYDLAITLNAWCFEPVDFAFNVTKARHFIAAYEKIRPLSADEKQHFVTLARGASLRFLLTRLHDWLFPVEGALVMPKNPLEYAKKLQFHRQFTHFSEYGV